MEKQQVDWFRAQLLEQRERVVAEVASHGRFPQPRDGDNLLDPEEQATRITGDLVEARITEDRGNLLRKIDLALERLDAGTYQECEVCGNAIPLERLRAKPSVSLCVGCQEARDAGNLVPFGGPGE